MADDFRKIQLQFAAHLRDPDNNPPPEALPDERLAVYRRLFLNNITNLVSSVFPVLHKIYGNERWQRLIKGFYSIHKSHTPYFSKVTKEFLAYLNTEYQTNPDDPPFLQELAHYEWIEFALSNANREIRWEHIDKTGSLLERPPVLSPLAWLLRYQWPVHQISPDHQPAEPGEDPSDIVLCRNLAGKIKFIKINAVTKALLEDLRRYPDASGRSHIENVSRNLNIPLNQQILQSGLDILEKMRAKEVILGTTETTKA